MPAELALPSDDRPIDGPMPGDPTIGDVVPDGAFGVYVHVPFCRSRCDYCAFATWTDRDHLLDRYVAALHGELALRRDAGQLRAATSVFFGGGTPSRLAAHDLCGVLDAIERVDGAEVTVEVNPEDASVELLAAYVEAGVTRVSFGVQSTAPRVLASLGRRHGTGAPAALSEVVTAVGLRSWNVDLIIGDPNETDDDLARTLDDVLGLRNPPPHVSAYVLTPEPGTPLGDDPGRHPDDDVAASRYELVDERLCAAVYLLEEISNWAEPGHEARHNWLYWTGGEYAGIGCSAHSHLAGERSWNVRTPERYLEAVEAGRDPTAASERLDADRARFEALSLLLRTRHGVPSDAFDDVEALGDLVARRGERVVLTRRGRLLASAVSLHLRGEVASAPR
jgi:oxygen-independent coproporphyrinogen-3 oxidase